jgi:hypothetical protein
MSGSSNKFFGTVKYRAHINVFLNESVIPKPQYSDRFRHSMLVVVIALYISLIAMNISYVNRSVDRQSLIITTVHNKEGVSDIEIKSAPFKKYNISDLICKDLQ